MTTRQLTEQERVAVAANALSTLQFVTRDQELNEAWHDATGVSVTSVAIGDLTGIPVEVVEAAVRNLGGKVEA